MSKFKKWLSLLSSGFFRILGFGDLKFAFHSEYSGHSLFVKL